VNRPLLALLVALFASGTAAAPVRALLPAYVESVLQQPPLLTSALLSTQLACGGLFSLAAGTVSDLISRRLAVLIGLTTALFGASLFLFDRPILLLGAAVLWGLAGGFQSAGGQSFLLSAVSRARLGSATAVYFVSGTASAALGAFLAGQLAERIGFRAVAFGAAGLALVALALAVLFLPSLGHDSSPRTATREPSSRDAQGAARSYRALLRSPDVLTLCALRYFPTVAWGAASLAFPLLVFRASGSAAMVGLYGTVSLLAASGAQLAIGREIDRRTKKGGISPRTLVVPLSSAILMCALAAAASSQLLAGLFLAGTLWAMSAWALSTTMPPLIHELGQGRDDGRLVALTHLLWSAGMLSGTIGAGALVDYHPALPFLLGALALAVTVAFAFRFARVVPIPSPSVT
jgi:MFS family permease